MRDSSSSQAIEPPPAPISIRSITGMRNGRPLPGRKRWARATSIDARMASLEVVEQHDLRGRAAHVEGHRLPRSKLSGDVLAEDRTAGRARFDEPDRETGPPSPRCQRTGRRNEQQRRIDADAFERFAEQAQITRHQRLDIGVADGRRGAFVLADLGADLVRERDEEARDLLPQDLADTVLVRAVDVGVQEADRDRLDVLRAQVRRRSCGRLVSSSGNSTLPSAAMRSGTSMRKRARNERLGTGQLQIVLVEAAAVGKFQRVAEALRREQRGTGAAPLDDRVGRECRAVHDHGDAVRPDAGLAKTCSTPASTPSSGASGVVSTLPTACLSGISSTTSVNVPPISTASLQSRVPARGRCSFGPDPFILRTFCVFSLGHSGRTLTGNSQARAS